MLALAVHHDAEWTLESHVAYILRLVDGGHVIEDGLLEDAVASVGVDCEIADTKGCEILEEVRALRGVNVIVLETSLDDDAGGRDVGPLDGNAQPRVAGAPTARTNEDVVPACLKEALVDTLNVRGNGGVVGCGEVVAGLDINHIGDIFRDAVSQGVVAAQQTVGIGYLLQVFIEHLLGIDNGAYLEQIEVA